jgi:hypothetical protein
MVEKVIAVVVAEVVAAVGSMVEDKVVAEVAEAAVAGAGVDVKATGFALMRGVVPLSCLLIFYYTRFEIHLIVLFRTVM